jgi:hypothetical protein
MAHRNRYGSLPDTRNMKQEFPTHLDSWSFIYFLLCLTSHNVLSHVLGSECGKM